MPCYHPISVQNKTGQYVTVGCGRCAGCYEKRRYSWVFRLKKELEVSTSAFFVTLTYNDQNLPRDENDNPTVVKKDLQDFFKRLRKDLSFKIRYYAVSEYGEQLLRPHYHIIFFISGLDYPVQPIEITRLIMASWTKGLIHIGTVTDASIAYVCGYVHTINEVPEYLTSPFALMSRKPGLGSSYLTDKMKKYHISNKRFEVVDKGYKFPLPRYYEEKIFDEHQLRVKGLLNKSKYLKDTQGFHLEQVEKGEPENWYIQNSEQSEKQKINRIKKTKKL